MAWGVDEGLSRALLSLIIWSAPCGGGHVDVRAQPALLILILISRCPKARVAMPAVGAGSNMLLLFAAAAFCGCCWRCKPMVAIAMRHTFVPQAVWRTCRGCRQLLILVWLPCVFLSLLPMEPSALIFYLAGSYSSSIEGARLWKLCAAVLVAGPCATLKRTRRLLLLLAEQCALMLQKDLLDVWLYTA